MHALARLWGRKRVPLPLSLVGRHRGGECVWSQPHLKTEATSWPGASHNASWSTSGPTLCSVDPPQENIDNNKNKQKQDPAPKTLEDHLFDRALKLVPRVGWSPEALHQAAQDLGLSKSAGNLITPADLILRFVALSNEKALLHLAKEVKEIKCDSLAENISKGLKTRLEMNKPVIGHMPQAMKILAHPSHAPKALALLHNFVDGVWFISGDRSMDMSWYMKRSALSGIYAAADLYMVADFSPSFEDTMALVDARVKNLFEAQKFVFDARSFLEMAYESGKGGLGQKLGWNPRD